MDFKRIKERIIEAFDGIENAETTEKARIVVLGIIEEIARASVKVPVRYIGHRDEHVDTIYGTMAKWVRGETKMVPQDAAKQMFRHTDVYAPGKADEAVDDVPEPQVDENAEFEANVIQQIHEMDDVDTVKEFIKTKFAGHRVSPNIGLDKAKEKAIQLVDMFGL